MSFSIPIKALPAAPKPPVVGLYLPTRNRSLQCLSVLMSWQKLAADPANLKILVGVDYDDIETHVLLEQQKFKICTFEKEVITNGERARILAESLDVDIYLAIVDYWYCLTPNWDNNLRHVMCNNEVANLACMHEIQSYNFTAISRKWRDLANHLESPFFPFWFCDQWRLEMACYVFNKSPELFNSISCFGRHERTTNMYDLDFWWGFFHALRPLRVKQCHEIAKSYGYAPESFAEFYKSRQRQIEAYTQLDFNKRPTLAPLEKQFGDLRPRSAKYIAAKERADNYIKQEGLSIWKMKPVEF